MSTNVNIEIAANNFYNKEASEKAKLFIKKIKSGELKRDTLPNRGTDYTGVKEFEDYINYTRFLESQAAAFLFKTLDEEYEYK